MVLSVSEPYLLSGDFVLCFDCVGQWFYLFPSLTCLVGIEMCCVVLCCVLIVWGVRGAFLSKVARAVCG